MNNSTAVRKKSVRGRPRLDLKSEILALIKNSNVPVSTSDIMAHLGKAWHTIDRACLMLQIESKLDGFKVGKMNLWRLK